MHKGNFLEKIVQKDYSNQLEKIIETKDFAEDVKNLLLSILYKVDTAYNDYSIVKRNVESKQEYIEKIIEIIKNKCEEIIIVKPGSDEINMLGERTFLVDAENKKIMCYPIERKLLYCISKIDKNQEIIRNEKFLINKTISNLINIGNNINTVEPLRDFNGWSWLIIKKEIENINYNLIYQNLRILLGEEFLNNWIQNTEYLIDYYSEFQSELETKFGEELKEQIIHLLEKLSILIEIEINKESEEELKELKEEIEKELFKFENKTAFIENITEQKKELNSKILDIEKIISDKELLAKEYQIRNENLPLEKKIFSKKILEKILKEEKEKILEEIEKKNSLLNPVKFVEEKTKLEKKYELIKIVDMENRTKEKNKMLEDFQKVFLKCFFEFIKKAETKEEIIDLLYKFRYYNLLPFNEEIDIYQNEKLQEELKATGEMLLNKAIDFKILSVFSEELQQNTKILKFIFETKIISLEEIYISIIKEKEKYYIELSENNENTYEEKFEIESINKDKLKVKLNKRIKIFA